MITAISEDSGSVMVPVVISKIDIATINNLQITNSSTMQDCTIGRTGAWNKSFSIIMECRDDLMLNFNQETKEMEIVANSKEDFLKSLKQRIELEKKIPENKNGDLVLNINIFEYSKRNENEPGLLDLLIRNFSTLAKTKQYIQQLVLKMTVDSIDANTDVTTNLSTVSVTGSLHYNVDSFNDVVLCDKAVK